MLTTDEMERLLSDISKMSDEEKRKLKKQLQRPAGKKQAPVLMVEREVTHTYFCKVCGSDWKRVFTVSANEDGYVDQELEIGGCHMCADILLSRMEPRECVEFLVSVLRCSSIHWGMFNAQEGADELAGAEFTIEELLRDIACTVK